MKVWALSELLCLLSFVVRVYTVPVFIAFIVNISISCSFAYIYIVSSHVSMSLIKRDVLD